MSETASTGVVCVITGPRGNVFAGTCFSRGQAAGFSQKMHQQAEAQAAAYSKLWKESVSVWFENADRYHRDRIIDQLIDGKEWHLTFFEVGGET